MTRRMYWGVAILILLLGTAAVFIIEIAENRQLKEQLAEAEKIANQIKQQEVAENNPRVAREGYKLVKHDDHFHEVPIDAPDTWQEQTPVVQPVVQTAVTTYTGSLTFHEELLKTNPVKALKLQAEERGHVNAKWIPPFPADDLEAQAFARNAYLNVYLDETDLEYEKVSGAYLDKLHAINNAIHVEGMRSARNYDLLKITWVVGTIPVSHYRGNVALFPSDYFPPIIDLK